MNKNNFLFVFLWMFWNSPASAQEKQCSAENLTAECRAFDSLPPVIVLPDGTSFKNPRKSQYTVIPVASAPMSNEKMLEIQDEQLDAQANLVKSLETAPVSEKFKSALANLFYLDLDLSESGVLSLAQKPGAPSSGAQQSFPVTISWPPEDNKAKLQMRSVQEILDYLNKSLPLETKKILKKFTDSRNKFSSGYSTQVAQPNGNMSVVTDARNKRIEDLIKFAKDSIERTLTGGRKIESLPPELQDLVRKVRSVEYNTSMSPELEKEVCEAGPNAAYTPLNNKFQICESAKNFPDSQLVTIIGHEIGHAIDSCNSSSGVQKVNSNLLDSFLANQSPLMTGEELAILNRIRQTKETALDIEYYFSPEVFGEFKKVELFTPKIQGVNFEKYPLLTVRDCIIKGSNLRSFSKNEIKEIVEKLASERKLITNTKTTEAEKQNPIKTDEQRLAAFSFYYQNVCDIKNQHGKFKSRLRRTPSILDLQAEIQVISQFHKDPHAKALVRINELFLAHPEVAATFNCKPHSNSECYKKFPTKLPGLEPLKISAPI